jgi:hypothetical protein
MARETRQYDPIQVIANVGGRDVSGYATGTFIEAERAVDAFTTVVGSDGEITRVKSQNRIGTIKITLQQASPLNDYFSSLATSDELSNGGVVPILVTDKNGTTVIQAGKAWVKKKPNATFADAAENREWIFESGSLNLTHGGQTAL